MEFIRILFLAFALTFCLTVIAVVTTASASSVIIPPAAFNPVEDATSYSNWGDELIHYTGVVAYIAPVYLPANVVVTRIVMFCRDQNADQEGYISLTLRRKDPIELSGTDMGRVSSEGSEAGIRKFSTSSISTARVRGKHFTYLTLGFNDNQNLVFYGAKVFYRKK